MIANDGGVILNMASVLGSEKAAPNRLAYAASKAAVAITRSTVWTRMVSSTPF